MEKRSEKQNYSFYQCAIDSDILKLQKSKKQPRGGQRFTDSEDPNGYWICTGIECFKYCRKPFALMKNDNNVNRRVCESKSSGFEWSDGDKTPAKCEKERLYFAV